MRFTSCSDHLHYKDLCLTVGANLKELSEGVHRWMFTLERLDCHEASQIHKLTHDITAVSSCIQGWSRVVFGRVSHHRPAGLHPVQLRCNDHSGDWTVRHAANTTMLLSAPCHSTSTPSHIVHVPEGREVVSSTRDAYCVFVLQVVL